MARTSETEQLFTDEEIRDTNWHYSKATDWKSNKIPDVINFLCKSTHNQQLTAQVQGSRTRDFTDVWNVGNTFIISKAGDPNNGFDYAGLSDFFPFMRIAVKASVQPASGKLNAWQEGIVS